MESFLSGDAYIHFEATEIKPDRKTLVFVNSLGTDFRIWRDIVELLNPTYNIVLHDKRGHGLSTLGTALHRIETRAQDVAALLDMLKSEVRNSRWIVDWWSHCPITLSSQAGYCVKTRNQKFGSKIGIEVDCTPKVRHGSK
jgi:hypothetical protein